ncbi:hypothetical protein [Persicitalea sp.]|uniref:hypothetical protein n=1 Tax=Persicitalea sp. TaxID=3100273 RepID=UPI0035936782
MIVPKKLNASYHVIFAIFLLTSCQPGKDSSSSGEGENALARAPDSWVDDRVEQAKTRLEASDAGKVVWAAMNAHGGLANWYRQGPIAFHFNYQPQDEGSPRNTYQVVDQWSNRAIHYAVGDSASRFGWDGKQAWVVTKDTATFPFNTRFWSLTPYYFMAQPFVLDGEGVNLELLKPISYEGKPNDVVKVTFADGTGDAPGDYYILYFDQETHLLRVIRYIVSYPGYFKDGGHMPEKFMSLEGEQNVAGFHFAKSYRTYWLQDDGTPGEYITKIDLSEISFKPDLPKNFFNKPEGATVSEGL